ncbi:uncharacterized protein LOC112501935 [Cynara cardunculus var. scolymus]|uniref:Uncharacterized protein n=1 Tax=Cynara cardunculus var. scolymus TaxID=59895 RepID=A0A103XD93_CYNCS|nr:uncharacterized protein LOC112501935 [Cynara cardunculus var. scolymus]KVH88579.1 hypothetical protein Ccrd_026433 [Cynara cardunculus var. scolymus]
MKQVDREIGDMISALTRRLAHLQKKPMDGANHNLHHQEEMEEEDDHRAGVGIITMAGTNEGATMRGEMMSMDQDDNYKSAGVKQDQSSPFTTYLNNNVQSVNNSIMVGGSYSANDPGIHLDVDDNYQGEPTRYGNKNKKKNKNNKETTSGSSTSDHSS